MTFYHKSGLELRKVTFDINGNAVFLDKEYDDYGNLKQESYPYCRNEDKLYVRNVYDVHNRIVEKIYPDGSKISYSYDGSCIQTEHTTVDGLKKYKKELYNFM
jgi:YD repeat-containing protein